MKTVGRNPKLPAPRIGRRPATVVVGIDPSLSATGLACAVDGSLFTETVLRTTPVEHRPSRLEKLRTMLDDFIRLVAQQGTRLVVAMESEIFMRNPTQSSDATAVQAIYQQLLYGQGCHYLPVNVSHVKKWLGATQKNEVLLQVYKKYKREYKDDNAADAFTICMIGDAYVTYVLDGLIDDGWTKPQIEVLDKLLVQGFPWEQPVKPRGKKRVTVGVL